MLTYAFSCLIWHEHDLCQRGQSSPIAQNCKERFNQLTINFVARVASFVAINFVTIHFVAREEKLLVWTGLLATMKIIH